MWTWPLRGKDHPVEIRLNCSSVTFMHVLDLSQTCDLKIPTAVMNLFTKVEIVVLLRSATGLGRTAKRPTRWTHF